MMGAMMFGVHASAGWSMASGRTKATSFLQMRASTLTGSLARVRFIGRWYQDGMAMRHSWGTGSFVVRFRGSTSVGVVMQNPSELYHVCQVDGGETRRLAHSGGGSLTIASGLAEDEEHTVRCGRSNEASYGETMISDVVLGAGGELLQAPGPNGSELRYEAIGDSITAGFKVSVEPGSSQGPTAANEDVFETYERHLADAWATSEWHVIARSGISVTPYGAERVMQDQWPCRSFSWGTCAVPWDFNWQADVVTVNLGTNDYVFGSPTPAQFEAAYAELLRMVREKYPNALIFALAPLQYTCGGAQWGASAQDPKWKPMVDGVQRAAESLQQSGDEKVLYHATGSTESPWLDCLGDYSDQTHPTVEGNRKFAERLLESLTADIRRFFPEKCGGTGSQCEGASAQPGAPAPAPLPSSASTTPSVPAPATAAPAPGPAPAPAPSSPQTCRARPGAQAK